MAETKQYTCIGCPIGCPLQLEHVGKEIKDIHGYECDRGAKYARQEFMDPRRDLTTTVAISGALWKRLPVKVTRPIPKDRVLEAAREIHKRCLTAPVKVGQVLIKDLWGEQDLHVVATRSMDRVDGQRP